MMLLVDPVFLAVPEASEGTEAFERYVDNILLWKEAIAVRPHDFVASKGCMVSLDIADRYPDPLRLQSVMRELGIVNHDYRDIHAICNHIATNLPHLEERIKTDGKLLVKLDKMHITPDLTARLPAPIDSALKDSLGHAAYAREVLQEPEAKALALMSIPLDGESAVRIDAVVCVLKDETDETVATNVPLIAAPPNMPPGD